MSSWTLLRRPGIALLAGAGVGRSAQTADTSPPPTRAPALLCSVQAAKGHRPYMEDDHDVARERSLAHGEPHEQQARPHSVSDGNA